MLEILILQKKAEVIYVKVNSLTKYIDTYTWVYHLGFGKSVIIQWKIILQAGFLYALHISIRSKCIQGESSSYFRVIAWFSDWRKKL